MPRNQCEINLLYSKISNALQKLQFRSILYDKEISVFVDIFNPENWLSDKNHLFPFVGAGGSELRLNLGGRF